MSTRVSIAANGNGREHKSIAKLSCDSLKTMWQRLRREKAATHRDCETRGRRAKARKLV